MVKIGSQTCLKEAQKWLAERVTGEIDQKYGRQDVCAICSQPASNFANNLLSLIKCNQCDKKGHLVCLIEAKQAFNNENGQLTFECQTHQVEHQDALC